MDNKDYEEREQEEVVLRVTAQYVKEVQAGHQPDISEYMARYPQYADAIAAFIAYYQAVELSSNQLAGSSKNIDTSVTADDFATIFPIAIETAWERVLPPENRDRGEIKHITGTGKHGVDEEMIYEQPLESLFMAAKQQQLSLPQVAIYLDISEDIINLLEQQALLAESIPLELCKRLASVLHKPVRTVQQYFGTERHRQVAERVAMYDIEEIEDAGDKVSPRSAPKMSFREVVNNSEELSAHQKSAWQDVLISEGL